MILDDLAAATRARVERKKAQIPLETVKEQTTSRVKTDSYGKSMMQYRFQRSEKTSLLMNI